MRIFENFFGKLFSLGCSRSIWQSEVGTELLDLFEKLRMSSAQGQRLRCFLKSVRGNREFRY